MTTYKHRWYKHRCHKKSWLFALLISLLFGILSSNVFAAQTKYTQAEIEWLKLNSNIKVAVSADYAPISFMQDDGQHAGISADYLAQIEEQLKAINPTFKFKTCFAQQS